MSFPVLGVVEIAGKLLDKVIPDPVQRDAAKLELLKQQQSGALEEVKTQLSAIMAEAQSADPWTSRARPSFMYVVYTLILFGIPMGLLSAVSYDTALLVAQGFNKWLVSIPDDLIELFKWVMLGYIGGRSYEKVKGAAK